MLSTTISVELYSFYLGSFSLWNVV